MAEGRKPAFSIIGNGKGGENDLRGDPVIWLENAKSFSCLTMHASQPYDENAASGFPRSSHGTILTVPHA